MACSGGEKVFDFSLFFPHKPFFVEVLNILNKYNIETDLYTHFSFSGNKKRSTKLLVFSLKAQMRGILIDTFGTVVEDSETVQEPRSRNATSL